MNSAAIAASAVVLIMMQIPSQNFGFTPGGRDIMRRDTFQVNTTSARGSGGRSWAHPLKPYERDKSNTARQETRPLVGKHIPAQEGLKVAMAMEYRSEGIGTICYVHPSGGWCSVIWDETGHEDRCLFTGDGDDYYLVFLGYGDDQHAQPRNQLGSQGYQIETNRTGDGEGYIREQSIGPDDYYQDSPPLKTSTKVMPGGGEGSRYVSEDPVSMGMYGSRGAMQEESGITDESVEKMLSSLKEQFARQSSRLPTLKGVPGRDKRKTRSSTPLSPETRNSRRGGNGSAGSAGGGGSSVSPLIQPHAPHNGVGMMIPDLQDDNPKFRVLQAATAVELVRDIYVDDKDEITVIMSMPLPPGCCAPNIHTRHGGYGRNLLI